jgi:predicted metal-binding membrane protein
MILVFVSAQAQHERPTAVPTWTFVAGYLLVWLVAGAVVYVLGQVGSNLATLITPTDLVSWKPIALGATLVAAGLYQFTPLKRVCLSHCRSPLAFVAQHWRDGRLGALQMGISHGSYCLGCCWALFAVLVAAGLMSLAWMLLLTLVTLYRWSFDPGRLWRLYLAALLWGIGLTVHQTLVLLTVPDW